MWSGRATRPHSNLCPNVAGTIACIKYVVPLEHLPTSNGWLPSRNRHVTLAVAPAYPRQKSVSREPTVRAVHGMSMIGISTVRLDT